MEIHGHVLENLIMKGDAICNRTFKCKKMINFDAQSRITYLLSIHIFESGKECENYTFEDSVIPKLNFNQQRPLSC